jgi:hypothetical protein
MESWPVFLSYGITHELAAFRWICTGGRQLDDFWAAHFPYAHNVPIFKRGCSTDCIAAASAAATTSAAAVAAAAASAAALNQPSQSKPSSSGSSPSSSKKAAAAALKVRLEWQELEDGQAFVDLVDEEAPLHFELAGGAGSTGLATKVHFQGGVYEVKWITPPPAATAGGFSWKRIAVTAVDTPGGAAGIGGKVTLANGGAFENPATPITWSAFEHAFREGQCS